jgi:hypothetical protein
LAEYCESLQAEELAAADADLAANGPDLPAADLSEANLPLAAEKAPLLCNHSQIMGVDCYSKLMWEQTVLVRGE